MTITTDSTVGAIASEYPLSTRVFAKYGIDFCCGGGKSLALVCEKKSLNANKVLHEIQEEINHAPDQTRWDLQPLDKLIDHILEAYHEPLREELPRLESMINKVNRVHGKNYEVLDTLQHTFMAIKEDLEQHLPKEEQVLFPMIKAGKGVLTLAPMTCMEREHEQLGQLLAQMRQMTNQYTPPEGACNTWRALWAGLADLESSLHEHIHLENNILHPRARTSSAEMR